MLETFKKYCLKTMDEIYEASLLPVTKGENIGYENDSNKRSYLFFYSFASFLSFSLPHSFSLSLFLSLSLSLYLSTCFFFLFIPTVIMTYEHLKYHIPPLPPPPLKLQQQASQLLAVLSTLKNFVQRLFSFSQISI